MSERKAAAHANQLGLDATGLAGGFQAWRAGLPVEEGEQEVRHPGR